MARIEASNRQTTQRASSKSDHTISEAKTSGGVLNGKSHLRRRDSVGRTRWWSTTQLYALLGVSIALLVALYIADDLQNVRSTLVDAVKPDGGPPPRPLQCSNDSEEQFLQMQRDMHAGGADVMKVALATFNGLRGLKTVKAVRKGTPLVSVPLAWTVSAASFSARQYIGNATMSWHGIEDADMLLDTLSLLYERIVRQGESRWTAYMCLLPQKYSLPISYRTSRAKVLLKGLPELQRLVAKRQAHLEDMLPRMRAAIQAMPGGQRALDSMTAEEVRQALLWAYSAAKTRTVQVELSKASNQLNLTPELTAWLTELGAMVPMLDMANFASLQTASTKFAVKLHKPRLGHKRGTLQLTLLAGRDMKAGEEVTFAYLPDDDDNPRCSERWLLEYGFPLDDGLPERGCHMWNITAQQVAVVQMLKSPDPDVRATGASTLDAINADKPPGDTAAARELLRIQAVIDKRLRKAKLPRHVLAHASRDGKIHSEVGQWLMTAVGNKDSDAGEVFSILARHAHRQLTSTLDWATSPAALEAEQQKVAHSTDTAAGGAAGGAPDLDAGSIPIEDEAWALLACYRGALAALEASIRSVGGSL